MPDTMEHERMRFSTMTFDQLRTRLGKITHQDKLNNFIKLCGEKVNEYASTNWGKSVQFTTLRELALKRKSDISKFGGDGKIPVSSPNSTPGYKKNQGYDQYGNKVYVDPITGMTHNNPANKPPINYDHSFRKATCFGGNLYNRQKACMTCSLEGECEKKWLENEEKKVPKKPEPRKPKAVIDVLPSRKIRID